MAWPEGANLAPLRALDDHAGSTLLVAEAAATDAGDGFPNWHGSVRLISNVTPLRLAKLSRFLAVAAQALLAAEGQWHSDA